MYRCAAIGSGNPDVNALGIIAATGGLPVDMAREAKNQGNRVLVLALKGFADPAIEKVADETIWIKIGHLEKAVETLKSRDVRLVVFAGKIEKSVLYRPWNLGLDRRAFRMIRSLKDWRDDTIMAAIAGEFEQDEIEVDELTPWVRHLMAPHGPVTKRRPTEEQWPDIEFGRDMARGIGALDIGQTVVVKNRAVVVVEAIEGTDRAIRRTKDLNVHDAVVVKMAKPNQNMRFDVPAVGPNTIDSMIEAGATVLAVEEGKTMIADRPITVEKAEKARIAIVGIPASGPL